MGAVELASVGWVAEDDGASPPPEGVELEEDVEENVSELCLLLPWGSARTTLGSTCCDGALPGLDGGRGGEMDEEEAEGAWP